MGRFEATDNLRQVDIRNVTSRRRSRPGCACRSDVRLACRTIAPPVAA